ncbi:MAG: ferrochelatase [Pseudomonadota bacterium]|jgi:ferrochelatase
MARPADHPVIEKGKVGVLLVNLGSPDAPTPQAVRRYLREFLSDRRVIEIPRPLWLPILYGPILSFRPRRSARLYEKIWDTTHDDAPLRRITRVQAEKLAARFADMPHVIVDWAMRYGAPSLAQRLAALAAQGCDRLLVFALYPQYAAATTASVYDRAFDVLKAMRWQPALRTAPPYHDDPGYIAAIAESIAAHVAGLDQPPQVVLASFHGLPQRSLEQGDPYHCQCQKTGRLVRQRLGWPEGQLEVTFQSRFGPAAWLQPYTLERAKALAGEGVKRLAIICPGFAADCLETLEEIAIGLREAFLAAGGEAFSYIPCLNAEERHIDLLAAIVRREAAGWI